MTEEEQRDAVLREARSWLRTPYHHAARVKGVGVDCAMLPAEIYHGAGIVPAIALDYYPRDWHHNMAAERYLGKVLEHATEIEQAEVRPGDFVLFKIGKAYAHGAIIMPPGWPQVLHADALAGMVIEARGDGGKMADPRCKPRFFTLWPPRTLPDPDSGEATARAESLGPRLHAKHQI